MAIVRELITLLGTEVDNTGFQQYEKGIARVKELALGVGKLLGLAFTVDKVIEFTDGLIDAGKEINKIRAQLNLVARPIDDMDAAQQSVFETAQKLGVAYKDVFETFKQFSTEMRETKIPQDEILKTTQNIYEALRTERASPEKIEQVMSVFERTFKRGAMRSVGVGQLFGLSPELFSMLEKAFNTNEDGLRKLAKEGKITAEEITKAFGKTNADLDEKFSRVPQKLGIVFTKIYNDLVNVTAQIYKLTDASVFMGKVVWYIWTTLTAGVSRFVAALGGLETAIRLVGIALAVAFGPYLLRTLGFAIAATVRWAIVSWSAVLPWLAMGAAVVAVAIAIEDIVGWMQGKKSVIGSWLGPFKDLSENFKNLDIFAGFRGIKDLLTGDFSGFMKEFKTLRESTEAEIALIVTAVGGIGLAFLAVVPFIRGVVSAIKLIVPAAETAATAIKTVDAAKATTVAKTGEKTLTGAEKPGPRIGQKVANVGQIALTGVTLAQDAGIINTGIDSERLNEAMMGSFLGSYFGPAGALAGGVGGALWKKPSFLPAWLDQTPLELYNQWTNRPGESKDIYPQQPAFTPGGAWAPKAEPPITPGGAWAPTGEKPITPGGAWAIPTPSVAPGALVAPPAPAGPVTTNVQPTFNQSNNIHVETTLDADQIGRIIGDKVGQLASDRFGAFARDVQVAAPRIEAATQ